MGKSSKMIIIILSVALIASVGFIIYENFLRQRQSELLNVYQLGVGDGKIQFLNSILSQIQTGGVAVITFPVNNQTTTLRLVPQSGQS